MNGIERQLSFLQDDLHLKNNGSYNDGYVTITKFMPDGGIINVPIKACEMAETLIKYIGDDNVFYSVNTSYNGNRSSDNIRQLVSLYADIDLKENMPELDRKRKKNEICNLLRVLADKNIIPLPSFLVDSGGGIHAYWAIKDLPYQVTWMWQAVEDHILFMLKANGVPIDSAVRDCARMLRSPGSKNGTRDCEVIFRSCIKYDLKDLYDTLIPAPARGPKADPKARLKLIKTIVEDGGKIPLKNLRCGKEMIKGISDCITSISNCKFTSYTLHQARLQDLKTLCNLRDWDLEGYRNSIMHCYVYWLGIIVRDEDNLLQEALSFNSRFIKPLPISSTRAIVRSALKRVRDFLKYEEDIRRGVPRRVSKGMRDKPGYWYKNITLINMLDISEEEQARMITIMEIQEKRKRKNKKRREDRRSDEGLLPTEIKRRNQFIVIAKLKEDGESFKTIAKLLDADGKTLRKKINKKYDKINYSEIELAVINNKYSKRDIKNILKNTINI